MIACALLAAPVASAGDPFPYVPASARAAHPAVAGTADFNADGHDDLLLLGNGYLATSPGDGQGGLGAITKRGPERVDDAAIADFNGDGVPDLATAAKSADDAHVLVTVSLNLGDGRFGAAATADLPADASGAPAYFADVSAGDFDGDGHADVAVRGSRSVAALRWSSGALLPAVETPVPVTDGTDGQPPRVLTPGGPFASGDLNEDGFDDLLVERQDETWGGNDLIALLGGPDGSFSPTVTSPGTGVSDAFTLADLDSDGHLDVLGSGSSLVGSHANLMIGYGSGDGGLAAPPQHLADPEGYLAPVVADFDRDGDADVVAALSQGPLRALEQTGSRSFGAPIDEGVDAGGPSTGISGGDFNEDGWPDIAVSRNGRIEIQLNRLGPDVREERRAFGIRIRRVGLAGSVGRLGRIARISGSCTVRCEAKLTFRLPRKAKQRTAMRSPVLATARVHWHPDARTARLRLHRPALRALRAYHGPGLKVLVIARGLAQAPTAPGMPRRDSDSTALQLRAG